MREASKGESFEMESPLPDCPCYRPPPISTHHYDAGPLFDVVTGGSLIREEDRCLEGIYIFGYHIIVLIRTL